METDKEWGTLVFCPTPIGNLQDITLRTLQAMRQADCIVCEDTRVTRKLLSHYHIHKPLVSFHKDNVKSAIEGILRILEEGKNCVLVTDAGTPGIQDPGSELIPELEKRDIPFVVLPGPSAVLPAVVYSGFASDGFIFLGFLPQRKAERMRVLQNMSSVTLPIVFFLSPHRLYDMLEEVGGIFGDQREAILCREITKLYEERIRGTLHELGELTREKNRKLRGELVLVVRGAQRDIKKKGKEVPSELFSLARELVARGLSRKEGGEIISTHFPVRKNTIKRYLHNPGSVDFTKEN